MKQQYAYATENVIHKTFKQSPGRMKRTCDRRRVKYLSSPINNSSAKSESPVLFFASRLARCALSLFTAISNKKMNRFCISSMEERWIVYAVFLSLYLSRE